MIPFTAIVKSTEGLWVFTWADLALASYRIVLAGKLLDTVTDPTYTSRLPNYDDFAPPLEVTGPDDLALSEQFPPEFSIQWYTESCGAFIIEQYDGSSWTQIDLLHFHPEVQVYAYTTLPLQDDTTYRLRVTAVTTLTEDLSTPREYRNLVVTPPASPEPAIVLGYDAGATALTIEAV
jgi:hypothetical protein